MSVTHLHRSSITLSPLSSIRRLAQAVILRFRRMSCAAEMRRELARMDAHMLQDLGVSRAQLDLEIDAWEHRRQ